MNIVNITLGVDTQPCSSITLGRRGENEVTQVVVDFSSWVEEFGAGVITLIAMRSQDTSAYPVVLSLDGNTATWNVTSTDTAYKGSGRAEYIYIVGEQIAKSVVFNTVVMQDIGEPSETPPDPYEEWLERLTDLGAETEAHAQAAEQSAENAAESAEDAAQSAESAEGYAGQAETAAGLAQDAQTASEAARDAAQTAQASAEASATAASGSATSAEGSATAAAGSASDASASATAAGASATAASASATTASNAATAAQTAQSAAEDAAEDAQQAAQQAHVEYEQLSGEVDDLSDEVSQQKSAIEDLQALTNRKAGMLVDTASGAIASFVPDATIPNLLGVTVDIEPVQDLHGYDSPWPAGGGQNLLDPGTDGTINGVTKTVNSDGTITFTGTATTTTDFYFNGTGTSYTDYTLPNGTYHIEGSEGGGAPTYDFFWIYQQNGTTKYANGNVHTPVTVNGTIPSRIFFRVYPEYTINLTVKLGLFAGDYQSNSWTPYSNECPIYGWNAVEVDATGINVFDDAVLVELGGVKQEDGSVYFGSGSLILNKTIWSNPTGYAGQLAITLKRKSMGAYSTGRLVVLYTDGTQDRIGLSTDVPNEFNTYTLITPTTKSVASIVGTYGTNREFYWYVQIEFGNTLHAYHPNAGNRYVIQLGQTIYGAKLTISEDGSVKALIDRAELVVTDCSEVGIASTGMPYARKNIAVLAKAESTSNKNISSEYRYRVNAPSDSGWFRVVQTVIYIFDSRFTDLATANSILSSEKPQIVFELITPIEIQLDPVTIATIAGQTNNVWADAGDVSVEFAADLKHYIDQKIAAAVAALS